MTRFTVAVSQQRWTYAYFLLVERSIITLSTVRYWAWGTTLISVASSILTEIELLQSLVV